MTRYALAICLVAILVSASAAAVQTIYTQAGDNIENIGPAEKNNPYDVLSCEIETNLKNKTRLYPDEEENGRRFGLHYNKCLTSIYKLTEVDTGKWTITMTTKNKRNNNAIVTMVSYNIKVRNTFQEKKIIPATSTYVYPDQIVSAQFAEHFSNFSSCKLLTPDNTEYDLASDNSETVKLLGQCGFRMVVKKEYHGKWKLIADLNNHTAYFAEFSVLLKQADELKQNDTFLFFKRGEKAVITGEHEIKNIKLCILEDPRGVKTQFTSGDCSMDIPFVTEHHQGVWKAYYGLEGIQTLVQQNIVVQVYDVSPLKSKIIRSNENINLLCQVRSKVMKYCSFVRPDGEIFHMTYSVGNNKYEYYGNGSHSQERSIISSSTINDCGITIHNPSNVDYGSWRCLVRVSNSETLGTVLKVPAPESRNAKSVKPTVTPYDVYAKEGDSFKIKCVAEEVLSYCWLRSPDGVVHTVIQAKEVKSPALKYEGEGLELGDCTAFVPIANETDAGVWTCHLGVSNGPELESKVNVNLRDSHLMATRNVIFFDSSKKTDLLCRPLPNSDKVIEACRWVNPLGHGINVDLEGRYFTETGTTHCRLSIHVMDLEKDIGSWSCYARFSDSLEEGSAQVIVALPASSVISYLSIALIISLLFCTFAGLFVLIMYKRRLAASRQPDEKIILEKPSRYP